MIKLSTNWYVYMLSCRDGTIYTGITTDLRRRLLQHNSPGAGARYTRSRRPVSLIYWERCNDRSAAAKREYQLKQLSASQKIDLAAGFTEKIPEG